MASDGFHSEPVGHFCVSDVKDKSDVFVCWI